MQCTARSRYPDNAALITATEAKGVFRLTEEDLGALNPKDVKRNPHRRSGPMMRLFLVGDVYSASKAKHADNPSFHPDRACAVPVQGVSGRDAVSARAATRLFTGGQVPASGPAREAWERVAAQHSQASRKLTQRELMRRWRGEMALAFLSPEDRELAMLLRHENNDGAPDADTLQALLQERRIRHRVLSGYR